MQTPNVFGFSSSSPVFGFLLQQDNDPNVHHELGIVLFRQNDLAAASDALNNALALVSAVGGSVRLGDMTRGCMSVILAAFSSVTCSHMLLSSSYGNLFVLFIARQRERLFVPTLVALARTYHELKFVLLPFQLAGMTPSLY